MVDSLRVILEQKIMVPVAERPLKMKAATWCWKVNGGFMAIWFDMKAAVNWDGETVIGRVSYNNCERCWTVWFTDRVASLADIYPSYDLEGMEA